MKKGYLSNFNKDSCGIKILYRNKKDEVMRRRKNLSLTHWFRPTSQPKACEVK